MERNDDEIDASGVRDGKCQSRDASRRMGNERNVDRREFIVVSTPFEDYA